MPAIELQLRLKELQTERLLAAHVGLIADAAYMADLENEIDVSDVDTELEGRGGDEHLELARLQPLLRVETASGR